MKETVFITGASSGIGRATALKFASEGHPVIINCKSNSEGLMTLEKEIRGGGGVALSYQTDVSIYENVAKIFAELKSGNRLPLIIINNAGISHIGLLQDMTPDEWRLVSDTNLTSVFNCCKAAIPYLINKKAGRIINISSMWGNTGASCETAYSASKSGVNGFTKALAKELAPSRISVNAIAFGVVDTRMNGFLTREERDSLIEEIPAGRIITPQECADIIYSVSMLNNYVTGQIITADGGMT